MPAVVQHRTRSLQILRHDVVVHVETVTDGEIAFAYLAEPHVLIEGDGAVAAVHVQLVADDLCFGGVSHASFSVLQQLSAETFALQLWQEVDLLQMEENTLVVFLFNVEGHVTGIVSLDGEDVELMPLVAYLFAETCFRIHPFHHVLHLLRGEDVAVGVTKCNVGHFANGGNVRQGGFANGVHKLWIGKYRLKGVEIGVVRGIEERTGFSAHAVPVDMFDTGKVGASKVKTAAVEDDSVSRVVNLPKATAVAVVFAPNKEVAMKTDIPEFENAVFADDEFLSHTLILREPTCSVRATR